MTFAEKVSMLLPENKLKEILRYIYYHFNNKVLRKYTYLKGMKELSLEDSGIKNGLPFAKLQDGPIFYGFLPSKSQRMLYRYADKKIKKMMVEEAFNVVEDIYIRYVNPTMKGLDRQKHFRIHKGDIVVELGSFLGYFTMKLSELVGEKGRIIAIEPPGQNHNILQKNITENHRKNITVISKGIWSKKGKMSFYRGKKLDNSLFEGIVDANNSSTIDIDNVDNILNHLKIEKADVIFVTINGAELEALKGMKKTLSRHPNLFVAAMYETNGKPNYITVIKILEERGYKTWCEKGIVFATEESGKK